MAEVSCWMQKKLKKLLLAQTGEVGLAVLEAVYKYLKSSLEQHLEPDFSSVSRNGNSIK